MLCPRCGADCGDSVRLCAKCQAQRDEEQNARTAEQEEKGTTSFPSAPENSPARFNSSFPSSEPPPDYSPDEDNDYAGFWLRVCSFLVDSLVVSLLTAAVVGLFSLVLSASLPEIISRGFGSEPFTKNMAMAWAVGAVAAVLGMFVVVFALSAFYYAIFESSPWQSTPGKRLAGTVVTDLDGQPISLGRALLRYIGKIVSVLLLCLGFLLPLFTERKQTLHDMMAGCVVRKREDRPLFLLIAAAVISFLLLGPVQRMSNGPQAKYRSIPRSESGTSVWTGGSLQPRQQTGGAAAPTPIPWPSTRPEPGSVPTPEPTPTPEETPEHFKGPHARIRSHSSMFDAQTVLAFYYPNNNSVAIGFFPTQLNAAEVDLLKRRNVLGNAGGHQRPLMTMYLDFEHGTSEISVKKLRSYTVNFYQDSMLGFTFDSVNDAVSFSKSAEQILQEDKIELSGSLRPGGSIRIAVRGKGAPRSNQKLDFRWDIDRQVVLFGSN